MESIEHFPVARNTSLCGLRELLGQTAGADGQASAKAEALRARFPETSC